MENVFASKWVKWLSLMTLSMTVMLAGVQAILKIQKLSNESVTNMHMHTTLKKY